QGTEKTRESPELNGSTQPGTPGGWMGGSKGERGRLADGEFLCT
ncbi:hypothetical protein E3A20_17870, partial [Planctomyces bekefii]